MYLHFPRGGLSFEFRTFSPDGMLMYSADKNQRDFISVFLKAGKVYFAFDTGSGDLIFTSGTDAVNDGSWKKVYLSLKVSVLFSRTYCFVGFA